MALATWLLSLLAACGSAGRAVSAQEAQQWSFPEPLRVCFASLADFSVRCNGSPEPQWEDAEQPKGSVPVGGWCQDTGEDFCGYDVEVWRCAPLVCAVPAHAVRRRSSSACAVANSQR